MLCLYAFPQCYAMQGLPLCYEDCMVVRQQFCYNEWALIEDDKGRDIFIRSRGHFRLPECEMLPKFSHDKPTCSHAALTVMDQSQITCELQKE